MPRASKTTVRKRSTTRRVVGASRRRSTRTRSVRQGRQTRGYKKGSSAKRIKTTNGRRYQSVIPKMADRAHYVIEDVYNGTMSWDTTTAVGGFVIPTNMLRDNLIPMNSSVATGNRWALPGLGSTSQPLQFDAPGAATRQAGLMTAFSRFHHAAVTHASLDFELTWSETPGQQPAAFIYPAVQLTVAPLSPIQMLSLVVQNVTSPGVVYTGSDMVKQSNAQVQAYAKSTVLTPPGGSKTYARIRHSIRHSKFLPLNWYSNNAYVADVDTAGTLTNPNWQEQVGFHVQMGMPSVTPVNALLFGVKIKLKLYCTFFEPKMTYLLAQPAPHPEEKKIPILERDFVTESHSVQSESDDDESFPGEARKYVAVPSASMADAMPPKAAATPAEVPGKAQGHPLLVQTPRSGERIRDPPGSKRVLYK